MKLQSEKIKDDKTPDTITILLKHDLLDTDIFKLLQPVILKSFSKKVKTVIIDIESVQAMTSQTLASVILLNNNELPYNCTFYFNNANETITSKLRMYSLSNFIYSPLPGPGQD